MNRKAVAHGSSCTSQITTDKRSTENTEDCERDKHKNIWRKRLCALLGSHSHVTFGDDQHAWHDRFTHDFESAPSSLAAVHRAERLRNGCTRRSQLQSLVRSHSSGRYPSPWPHLDTGSSNPAFSVRQTKHPFLCLHGFPPLGQ